MPSMGGSFVDADVQDVGTYTPILAAIRERELSQSLGKSPTSSPVVPVAPGTDVQAASFWSDLQQRVANFYDGAGAFYYLKSGFGYEGNPPFSPTQPFDRFGFNQPVFDPAHPAAETGISAARYIGISQAFAAVGKPGWMRKRPREIDSPTAVVDTQGNLAANGQKAYCLDGGVFPAIAPGQMTPYPPTTLYQRVGGAWVPLDGTGETADTLVGEAGAERTISSLSATTDGAGRPAVGGMLARYTDGTVKVFNAYPVGSPFGLGVWGTSSAPKPDVVPTSGSGVACGPVQAGDYIGPWLLAELCDMLRAIGNRTTGNPNRAPADSYSGTSEVNYNDQPYDRATYGDAVDAADADWSQRGPNGSPPCAYATLSRQTNWPSGDVRYLYTEQRISAEFYATTSSHRPRTVHFGGVAYPPSGGYQPEQNFSAQGDGVAEGIMKVIGSASVAMGTADSGRTTFPSSVSGIPTTRAPDPPPTTTAGPSSPLVYAGSIRGWGFGAPFCVVEWDFEYT